MKYVIQIIMAKQFLFIIYQKKDLLFIPTCEQLSVINIDEYNIAKLIDVSNSGWIKAICL